MTATMLSLTKRFSTIPIQILHPPQHRHLVSFKVNPIKISSSSGGGNNTTSNDQENTSEPIGPPITPPNTVEIRYRRRSRRKRKQLQDAAAESKPMKAQPVAPKDWEAMTLTEKALELYMGEKGLLFWLNKFAYASIFIIIGGWIFFRFVGPAFNLYQLDSPPLSPSSMFKGP